MCQALFCTQCAFLAFQDSADEAKKKSDELLTAFEELQKLLKEANEGTFRQSLLAFIG